MRAILTCWFLIGLAAMVDGHGFMFKPASRNSCASCNNYCPHCLNAGGPGWVQSQSPNGLWPAVDTEVTTVRRGLCGDQIGQPQLHLAPKPVVETYQKGQVIDVEMRITAHHQGHIELRLCDNANALTQTCLNKHLLNRVDTDESPIDPRHPNRWYLPPNSGGYSAQFVYKAQFKLPDNVTCTHCVLQWWYVTANSCLPPDYNQFNFPTSSWWSPGLSACGTVYGEEFWNCADVAILDGGSAAPTTSGPSTTAGPTAAATTTALTSSAAPPPPPVSGNQCTGCVGGSSGTCKAASGACFDAIPGTNTCWAGTSPCGSPASSTTTTTTTTTTATVNRPEDCSITPASAPAPAPTCTTSSITAVRVVSNGWCCSSTRAASSTSSSDPNSNCSTTHPTERAQRHGHVTQQGTEHHVRS
eukprot:m.238501 g.238501  ORF g.238501 m.238501 type:complete len:415 (-) comp17429_c0_seq19:1890-3134(-)